MLRRRRTAIALILIVAVLIGIVIGYVWATFELPAWGVYPTVALIAFVVGFYGTRDRSA